MAGVWSDAEVLLSMEKCMGKKPLKGLLPITDFRSGNKCLRNGSCLSETTVLVSEDSS